MTFFLFFFLLFFFNDTATTEIYTLSLHDALPISINTMITQIAGATEEQTSVTEEISINVTSIKTIAEKVADGAQQTTSATDEIVKLASELDKLISKFRVS